MDLNFNKTKITINFYYRNYNLLKVKLGGGENALKKLHAEGK
jgi:hypothetical protein